MRLVLQKQGRERAAVTGNKSTGTAAAYGARRHQRAGAGQQAEDTSQVLGGGSCRCSRLFVGERLDCPAGLRAVQGMGCLVSEGEGELIAIGGSRGVVGIELGGFAV